MAVAVRPRVDERVRLKIAAFEVHSNYHTRLFVGILLNREHPLFLERHVLLCELGCDIVLHPANLHQNKLT